MTARNGPTEKSIDASRRRFARLARALFGVIAFALSLVCFFVSVDTAFKLAQHSLLPQGPPAISPYLVALSGAVLLSFAVGQAIMFFHVGGDQREDARLWAQLSRPERSARMSALDSKAIWAFRSWMGSTFIAIVALHAITWEPLTQSLLSLQVEAIALVAGTVAIAAFGLRWFKVIRPRDADSAAPEKWISTRRWILQAQPTSFAVLAILWIVGLVAAATVARGFLTARPVILVCILQAFAAAAILWGALTATMYEWRLRGKPAPVLRLLREQDYPLLFTGMLDFAQPLAESTRNAAWVAELQATYWVYGRWPWRTWFTVAAPVSISRDAKSGAFRLPVDALPPPPSPLLSWSIRIQRGNRKNEALYFTLPQEAVYLEEFAVE